MKTESEQPDRYFIIRNEETKGPYTIGQLRSMWNSGAITGDTLYCEEGYEEWLHLRVLADQLETQPAAPALSVSPPPMPAPQRPKTSGIGKFLGFGCLGVVGLFVLVTIIVSISGDSGGGKNVSREPQQALSSDEYERLCKGVVSTLFNQPIDNVTITKKEGDVVYLAYTRKSDATVWRFKCRIEGATIIWGNDDGRWRTDDEDEKLSFALDRVAHTFTIQETFSDGSGSQKTFPLE